MAYDEGLAHRIRDLIDDTPHFEEKKMFGGLAFMYKGKMSVGINEDVLMTRCRKNKMQEFLSLPNVREMDFTGKALKGFLYIDPEGIDSDDDLQFWIDEAITYVESEIKV